jgi:hypothetical protein
MANRLGDCESYREDLSALIDGELSSQREVELNGHLSRCADCSLSLERLRGVDPMLAAIAMPEVPEALRLKLLEEIRNASEAEVAVQQRPTAPAVGAWFMRPAVAAPLALAASVALYVAMTSEPTSNVDPEVPMLIAIEEAALAVEREPRIEEIAIAEPVELQVPLVVEEIAPVVEREPRIEEVAIAEPIELELPVVIEGIAPAVEREPRIEEIAIDEPVATPAPVIASSTSELEAASEEELAVLLRLETIQDLDVIANLKMLERLMKTGEGTS